MKMRLICREDDAAMAANVGGAVNTKWRTFDVDLPAEIGEWLTEPTRKDWTYCHRIVNGVELDREESQR